MRVQVTIECPGVFDADSAEADWCVDEIAAALERSGLEAGGYVWSIDDASVEGGAA